MDSLQILLQIIIALGILNVWLIRAGSPTSFRGGDAKSLREEFHAYGLSDLGFTVVGIAKVACAVGLVIGIWVPSLVLPSAVALGLLMIGALAMHIRVRDPFKKSLPAACVLALCALVIGL